MTNGHRYCGRDFTAQEIDTIRRMIEAHPTLLRAPLSRWVCQVLQWRRHDGHLKDMSCRVAMLRMQKDGLIALPPPRYHRVLKPYRRRTSAAEPPAQPVSIPVGKMHNLYLELIIDKKSSHLWNEYMDRYHYLGYTPLPGAQLRYLVYHDKDVLAALGFGAAAWKAEPRDRFIGWTSDARQKQLHLIVNNARFLILPWIHSRNLASHILSRVLRRLPDDWYMRYKYRPVLVETFVETPRFLGTCYKAANWIYVGDTKGRGKLDVTHSAHLPIKAIWVYPLTRNFRHYLKT